MYTSKLNDIPYFKIIIVTAYLYVQMYVVYYSRNGVKLGYFGFFIVFCFAIVSKSNKEMRSSISDEEINNYVSMFRNACNIFESCSLFLSVFCVCENLQMRHRILSPSTDGSFSLSKT